MTQNQKAWFGLAVVTVMLALWEMRLTVTPLGGGVAYAIENHLTGETRFCVAAKCTPTE